MEGIMNWCDDSLEAAQARIRAGMGTDGDIELCIASNSLPDTDD